MFSAFWNICQLTTPETTIRGVYLVINDSPRYTDRMARPKEFERRIQVRFPAETVSAMQKVVHDKEDRSDFIRAAVETEVAIRRMTGYEDLRGHLTANETIPDFCARAVKRAILQRKAALAEPEAGEPRPGEPDTAAE